MMVLSLWAMVMMVHVLKAERMVFWIKASVSMSTAAVASSSTRILVLRNSVLARHTSCRCPTLEHVSSVRGDD